MKARSIWLGFAVIAAIALFSTVSCESPDNGGGGGTTTFTVTFNLNGGGGTAPAAQPVKDGESITLPGGSGLTRSGYIFGGWNTKNDGTGTNYNAGSSYKVTGNITLYAKWIDPEIQVPGEALAAKLQWLVSNAESNGAYVLELSRTYESIGPQTLSYTGRSNISVRLRGSGNSAMVVELSSNGSLFTIGNGVTLILDNNIALSGRSGNETSLIGINSGGTFTMSGGRISGNTIGGGVSVGSGTFTMNGGTISGNAGGVSVGSGTFTMSGGRISGNTIGGEVSVGSGTFTMNGGTISGNTAERGGVSVGDGGTFTMSGGTISGNTASFGGGVDVYGTFTMSGGRISGNGYGVYVSGAFTMSGGTISGNTASGGVRVNSRGTFTMNGGEISGNTASFGGGVDVSSGTFTMNNGTISGNTASYGGGVDVSSGTFAMNGGTISGNQASSSGGGGVYVLMSSGTFTMNNGTISGNQASSYGGGVLVYGTFTMNGGEISGNTARGDGGGVDVGGTFTMNGGEISGNTASRGGGVSVGYSGTFRISTGTIYGSNADTLSNTAGTRAALDGLGTAQLGTFSGTTWVSAGSLSSTDDTIRVVDGVLQ